MTTTQKPLPQDSDLPAAARRRYFFVYLTDMAVAPLVSPRKTLLVSGFWRSGTSWLQESLSELMGAKMVFEPLQYRVREMGPILEKAQLTDSALRENLFLPYHEGSTLDGTALYGVLARALRSTLPGAWIRLRRPNRSDAFRRKVVVKITRGNLILHAAQQTFQMPVVHVYRDPRAIIASIVYKTKNMFGRYTGFSAYRQLLEIPDGRAQAFQPWLPAIQQYTGHSLAVDMALFWAITERYLADQYARRPLPQSSFVQYETLARAPEKEIPQILTQFDIPIQRVAEKKMFKKSSSTSSAQSLNKRLFGWRDLLPAEESEMIAEIAREFGFEDRLVD